MGQSFSFDPEQTLEAQIKALEDEELLDFWEETQQLASMLCQQCEGDELDQAACQAVHDPEYERLILQELQVRRCLRGAARRD